MISQIVPTLSDRKEEQTKQTTISFKCFELGKFFTEDSSLNLALEQVQSSFGRKPVGCLFWCDTTPAIPHGRPHWHLNTVCVLFRQVKHYVCELIPISCHLFGRVPFQADCISTLFRRRQLTKLSAIDESDEVFVISKSNLIFEPQQCWKSDKSELGSQIDRVIRRICSVNIVHRISSAFTSQFCVLSIHHRQFGGDSPLRNFSFATFQREMK